MISFLSSLTGYNRAPLDQTTEQESSHSHSPSQSKTEQQMTTCAEKIAAMEFNSTQPANNSLTTSTSPQSRGETSTTTLRLKSLNSPSEFSLQTKDIVTTAQRGATFVSDKTSQAFATDEQTIPTEDYVETRQQSTQTKLKCRPRNPDDPSYEFIYHCLSCERRFFSLFNSRRHYWCPSPTVRQLKNQGQRPSAPKKNQEEGKEEFAGAGVEMKKKRNLNIDPTLECFWKRH